MIYESLEIDFKDKVASTYLTLRIIVAKTIGIELFARYQKLPLTQTHEIGSKTHQAVTALEVEIELSSQDNAVMLRSRDGNSKRKRTQI
jgi:hypothetical protein